MSSERAEIRRGPFARALARCCVVGVACAASVGFVASFARAEATGSPYPYGGEFHQQLDEFFFTLDHGPDALANPEKLAAYRAFVQSKLSWLRDHVANLEVHEDGEDRSEAREEALELDLATALRQIQDWLEQLAVASDTATAHELAADIVTLEYATRSFAEPLESIKIPIHLKNIIFEWRSPKGSRARHADREATNLVHPDGGFYTPDQLAEMIEEGFDISTLQPPSETPFWRKKKDISRVDIVENYLEGGDPVHEGIVSRFPTFDGAVFELRKVHKTQTKPKLDVWYADPECAALSRKKQKKCRRKLKLKFGMETHADPPANALLSALGYNIDVSMHLKNIRIYLGKFTLNDLEREWIGYFDQQRLHTYFPLHSVMSGKGEDERGSYVIFQEAVAELKPPEIVRIGFFPFSRGVSTQFREARGLFLFNVWIGNADMKDDGNNKVALRETADGEYGLYMLQQDVGHSLGWILPERPENFPWELVEDHAAARLFGALNRSIEYDYIDLQDNGLKRSATYADVKWMARMIASLTRDQITAAIDLGVWPGGIGQLYIEKLIHRRNQLVEVLGLEDEFEIMPVDRHITTPDGSVVDGHVAQGRFPDESPANYGDHLGDLMNPVFGYLGELFTGWVHGGIGAVDVINPGDINIGNDLALLPRILIKLSRRTLLNPEPAGAFDQYVVVDSMDFGLRLGLGYIGSVEGSALKRVSLAYPVSTYRRGLYSSIGAMNFLRSDESRAKLFPDKYVLFREDLVATGARASSDSTDVLSPLGIEASHNWVWSQRSVLDNRGENPLLWLDEPRMMEQRIQFFLELFEVVQVPFMGGGTERGHLEGRLLELDRAKLGMRNESGERIFDAILQDGNFDDADLLLAGEPLHARSDFSKRHTWWSLIFVSARARSHEETITLTDPAGEVRVVEHQAERRSSFHWAFMDNAELQQLRVNGYLDGLAPGGLNEPYLVVRFDVDDKNTHSDEFDSYYRLLESLGANRVYMAPGFSAEDWEITGKPSGRWARLLTSGRVELYPEAVEALMDLDEQAYWTRLAGKLELSRRELDRHRSNSRFSSSKRSLVSHRRPGAMPIRRAILRSNRVLSELQRARRTEPGPKRLRTLVNALFYSSFRRGDTFDTLVLTSLLEQVDIGKLADEGALHVEGRITRAFEDEQNFPERRDVLGRLGKPRDFRQTQYSFFPFTGLELYNMLNWTRDAAD